ncbi:hypothetical protein GCM10010442_31070 [Kitasatospora kifunensis]
MAGTGAAAVVAGATGAEEAGALGESENPGLLGLPELLELLELMGRLGEALAPALAPAPAPVALVLALVLALALALALAPVLAPALAPALALGPALNVMLGLGCACSADVVLCELPQAQASARVRIAAQPPAARRSRVRWVPRTGMRQLLTWYQPSRVVAAVPYDDGRRSGSSEIMKVS